MDALSEHSRYSQTMRSSCRVHRAISCERSSSTMRLMESRNLFKALQETTRRVWQQCGSALKRKIWRTALRKHHIGSPGGHSNHHYHFAVSCSLQHLVDVCAIPDTIL